MKQAIRSILGADLVSQLINFKIKWFPNKFQKMLKEQEAGILYKRKEFYGSFVNKNDLCFDVGANIGNRVTPLLEIGAKVVAVEPQESCYKILQKKFGNKIDIVTKGLGEFESVKDFHISNDSTMSSFSNEWIDSVKDGRFKEHNWDKVVRIEMTTLDLLIEKFGLPVFIKIDVEGYELDVLKGLSRSVKMISFEYTVPEQVDRVADCIRQIEKNNDAIECNYSIGEGMVFALQEWLTTASMYQHIRSNEFINTEFGDVYVRVRN